MKSRLNLPFLAALVTGTALLSGLTVQVHELQVQRHASAWLDRARRAQAGHDLGKTEEVLGKYLRLRPRDGAAWAWYARVTENRDGDRLQREHVFYLFEQALRYSPGDAPLTRRCAEMALELGRYSDAQGHLRSLLEQVATPSPDQAAAAELEEMLGQCARGLARYAEAEDWLLRAQRHDPHRVSAYDRLARLRRTDLGQLEAAEATIREMVAQNPKAGRAYLYRWRYAREFAVAADANDLPIALGLAPEDPEVLLAAARASEQKPDPAGARAYLEKGYRLYPQDLAFVRGLARLETQEGHLDRAAAVLRRADEANPLLGLAFELAEVLILQDKIDGADGAAPYLTRLRNRTFASPFVPYLEARILFQRQQWAAAIPRIEKVRARWNAVARLAIPMDLMLAECYGQVDAQEQRLEALQRAAARAEAAESVRITLARALAGSGRLDPAIAILRPLAERQPGLQLDLVRLLIEQASRQPAGPPDWPALERQLRAAEAAGPRAGEPLVLLRADLLAAQGRLEEARTLLSAARDREPRHLPYRLALVRLAQRQGQGPTGLRILDQAETELGPSPELRLARLDYWGIEGGDPAKAALAQLAELRHRIPAADRPAFLDRLAAVALRLGEPARARAYWRELAGLQAVNLRVLMGLFDLALRADDRDDARALVAQLRAIEGEAGTLWRFGQASFLLDQARCDRSEDLTLPKDLAAEIAARRPEWWGGAVLRGEIAELEGHLDQAVQHYTRAVEQGNTQPHLARRLVALLNEHRQDDRIEQVVKILAQHGVATRDLVIATALQAVRRQDPARGLVLARQVLAEDSPDASDHLFLGRFYQAAGQPREAGPHFRRAVELGPGVPRTWVSYVQHLVEMKQVDQAQQAASAARQALPADRAGLALAQCAALVGDIPQAEARIEAVLDSPACDLAAIRFATELYLNQGRFDRVESILGKLAAPALKATPDDLAWANRARVRALLSTGRQADRDRALALVEENLKANPTRFDDVRLEAVVLAQQTRRRREAIPLLAPLDEANRLGPDDQFLLARIYLAERRVDQYRVQMLKLLSLGVKEPRYLAHFVAFLIDRRELDQTDYWLAQLERIAPRALSLLELKARLLKARNRGAELLGLLQARARQAPDEIGAVAGLLDRFDFPRAAEAAYRAFVARDPSPPERVLALAEFLARQDRVAEALEILKKAWATCPPEQVASAALTLYDAPSADEAQRRQVEAFVVRAIQEGPKALPLCAKLGVIRMRQGRRDEAEGWYRRVLARDPDNPEALNSLAWLVALSNPDKAREALDLINRAIANRGPIPSLLDTRAVVLIRAGRPDQAIADLRQGQELAPRRPSLPLHLAWAYQARGEIDQARRSFQQASDLGWRAAMSDPLERALMEKLGRDLGRARNEAAPAGPRDRPRPDALPVPERRTPKPPQPQNIGLESDRCTLPPAGPSPGRMVECTGVNSA